MKNNIKRVLMITLFISIIFSGIKYLDLCISEKYETQLEGLSPTVSQIKAAKELKKEIDSNKKIVLSIIVFSLILIYPISLIKGK